MFVYVIEIANTYYVKVGMTINPQRRIAEFSLPINVLYLLQSPNTFTVEPKARTVYSSKNLNKRWAIDTERQLLEVLASYRATLNKTCEWFVITENKSTVLASAVSQIAERVIFQNVRFKTSKQK